MDARDSTTGLRIEMTDQRGLNDDNVTSSPRAVSIEEFWTLTQRVAAQERQLEEILMILRASVAATSVPSTARITVTGEANTPVVMTTTTFPTTHRIETSDGGCTSRTDRDCTNDTDSVQNYDDYGGQTVARV
ncbi:hypothetical protein Sjap_004658 [Stephania japonica]|uniref:Uncharacterized protein n=1 Tax=Stephania japonica TaxID=461633 RepID=A0AAP0K3M3_9MAGN